MYGTMACNSCQNEKKITLRIYFYFIVLIFNFFIFDSGLNERNLEITES